MFEVIIDNEPLVLYDSLSFRQNFNAMSSQLTINFNYEPKFNAGSKVILKFNKINLLTGFIDNLEVEYTSNETRGVINCRDNTSDVIDSTMKQITRDAGYSFIGLVQELTGLQVINKTGSALKLLEPVESRLGMGLEDFLNSIAKQLGVFLRADGSGNIIIFKVKPSLIVPVEIKNPNSFRIQNDISDRYNRYTCYAKKDSELTPEVLVAQKTDSEIRKTRFCVFEAERTVAETQELQQLTQTKLNLKKAKGKAIYLNLPLENYIYNIGEYAIFKNQIYFIDEISYNVGITNKNVQIRLVDKDTYVFS